MIIGVSQLGLLYFAHSGVHHAVEQAARTASIFPKPTNDVIRTSLESSRFGMAGTLVPSITDASADAGRSAIDISLSYVVPLDFIFFQTPPVTLSHTRRVFTQLPFNGVTPPEDADEDSKPAKPPKEGTTEPPPSGGSGETPPGGTTTPPAGSPPATNPPETSPPAPGKDKDTLPKGNGDNGECKNKC
jgi:hypothetical protein